MIEVRPNSIQFYHKQSWFGIILMVRDAQPADAYGDWQWSNWRRAKYYEYELYMRSRHVDNQ